MYELLFDIKPQTSQIRVTIRLATLLSRKGNQVYYTHTSDSIFTMDLLKKGIGRVLYPDDLQWFTPNLALLDYLLKEKASVYSHYGIRYMYVIARKNMDGTMIEQMNRIPLLYLPPSPYQALSQSARETDFIDKIEEIKEDHSRSVIIGVLEEDGYSLTDIEQVYKAIKYCGINNPGYQFIILTNQGVIEEKLFVLPENISVYRPYDLQSLLPLCDMALVRGDGNANIECVFAHIPVLELTSRKLNRITPLKLEKKIKETIGNRDYLINQQKQLCHFYLQENLQIDSLANWIIEQLKKNRK